MPLPPRPADSSGFTSKASFPGAVWDGTSDTRETRYINDAPDAYDWRRLVDEFIATQQHILDNPGGGSANGFKYTVTTVDTITVEPPDGEIYIDGNLIAFSITDANGIDLTALMAVNAGAQSHVTISNGTDTVVLYYQDPFPSFATNSRYLPQVPVLPDGEYTVTFSVVGRPGTAITSGASTPSSDGVTAGDLYLDTSTSDLYQWNGTWSQIVNLKGAQGDPGPTGDQGNQGEPGATGATGEQGIQGEPGIQGEQGIQGIQGEQGIQGIQGEQGIQGDPGAPGTPGYPEPPGSGTYVLTSVDGVVSWV